MITALGTRLGPGTVLEVEGNRVRLRRDSETFWAQLALSAPCRLEPGDRVLAIGEDEVYVIGILQGHGRIRLTSPGDLELSAGGKVVISGERGLELAAPEFALRADRVEIAARSVFERCVNAYRWIKETIHVRAGRARTVVEGPCTVRAERIVETAAKDVKIDGAQIHLG